MPRFRTRNTTTRDPIDGLEFNGPYDNIPERSPLHKDAINKDELKVGLNIIQRNIHDGRGSRPNRAIINGEPFRRGIKYHGDSQADAWMVPVVTTNYAGKLVHEDWFLTDMGVAPSENSDGTGRFWNDQNYTLAVS